MLFVWVWFSVEWCVVNILVIARWREWKRGWWYYWNKLCSVVYLACMYGVQNTVLLSHRKTIYCGNVGVIADVSEAHDN